jgi:hypothetical protein
MIINKDTMMNTQHTVLLMGALAKVMELSRTHCSVLAEQTTISLRALNRCTELPPSLKAQIEEMLDTLEEQYRLERQPFPGHELKPSHQDNEEISEFCVRSMLTRNLPLYADASLE